MFTAYIAIAIVASLLLAVSGLGKLHRNAYIVRTVHEVARVPIRWFPFLAAMEFAAATGLLVGIRWPSLGVAAAVGMTLYFVGAIIAHVRVSDIGGSSPALQMFTLAVAALITRIFSM